MLTHSINILTHKSYLQKHGSLTNEGLAHNELINGTIMKSLQK